MIDINKKKCYIFFENLIKERKICKFSTCTVVYFNLGMTNTQCHLEIMLILHAIKSLFLYFNLCPSIEMVILLCSLIISISFLTNYIHEEVVLCYKTFCEFYPPPLCRLTDSPKLSCPKVLTRNSKKNCLSQFYEVLAIMKDFKKIYEKKMLKVCYVIFYHIRKVRYSENICLTLQMWVDPVLQLKII